MIKVNDLEFKKFIQEEKILGKVESLAKQINKDYKDRAPLFMPILNGSYVFAADLTRHVKVPCRVSFLKHSSVQGTTSTGQLKTLIGMQESIFNQDLILVEDLMDTGLTLSKVVEELQTLGTKSVEIVTLFRKAKARAHAVKPKYVGFEIENEFILGYGLDYNGFGRNYPDVYKLLGEPPVRES